MNDNSCDGCTWRLMTSLMVVVIMAEQCSEKGSGASEG